MTTFNGFPIAGQTQHFLVTYADVTDTDALVRAQALLTTCEADLTTLQSWFSCTFNPGNATWVHVDHGSDGGGAENWGYNSSGSSQIYIHGTNTSNAGIAGEVARMLFVAEFIEILMDYTSYGWQAGNSAGEALSRVAAAELHPLGYYSNKYGPYVNKWLQSNPRPDWVSNPENTDLDKISFGCGILFIYFLVYQLGFSFSQIVAAAGSNGLAQIFATLTKQSASTAFTMFTSLLNQHLPVGKTVNVPRDNVFPLLDPAHRHIAFASSWKTISSTQNDPDTHSVTLEVCHGSLKSYSYWIEDVITEVSVTAFADGYADATFTWSIGGTPLPWSGGNAAISALVPVTITDTEPDSEETPVPGKVLIWYIVITQWNKSTLVLRNGAFLGNGTIDITAQANEVLVNDQQTAHTETVALPMRTYDMGTDYWTDSYKCRGKAIWEMSRAVASLIDSVIVLKNAPDPSPEQMIGIAAIATRYTEALRAATNGIIGLRAGVATSARQMRQSFMTPTTGELSGIAGGSPVLVRIDLGARLPSRGDKQNW